MYSLRWPITGTAKHSIEKELDSLNDWLSIAPHLIISVKSATVSGTFGCRDSMASCSQITQDSSVSMPIDY